MNKPSIPSGTRDFSPLEVTRRLAIFKTIRDVFEKYGYEPIETPTMEYLSTLEGKYGDEGDTLLYRVLNSGNILELLNDPDTSITTNQEIIKMLSAKGLRYDLTVPFARYVVMHHHEITFPFRRYQIQPVFRADRPQKGRYREFYQCDADVVGSESQLLDAELASIYDDSFNGLKLEVEIRINHRKILQGISEVCQASDRFTGLTVAIDKLDKIGLQGVRQELTRQGFTESQLQVIEKFFLLSGSAAEKVNQAAALLSESETGKTGCAELNRMLDYVDASGGLKNDLIVDFTLARGLNYYTGIIYEVVAKNATLKSSVGGGGRYDDLTGIFGLKGVSGVGISFGADRIYDVLEELDLFPPATGAGTRILFTIFDEASIRYCLPLLREVRKAGIASEIFPSAEKMKKQLKYAAAKNIPFVAFAGETERASASVTIKNMETGDQSLVPVSGLPGFLGG